MNQKSSNPIVVLLTDMSGRILGMAPAGGQTDEEYSIGIVPLPGQSLYVVEVPDEEFQLNTTHDVDQLANRYYVQAGEKPQLKPLEELLKLSRALSNPTDQGRSP